jgi:hypothetical protein
LFPFCAQRARYWDCEHTAIGNDSTGLYEVLREIEKKRKKIENRINGFLKTCLSGEQLIAAQLSNRLPSQFREPKRSRQVLAFKAAPLWA